MAIISLDIARIESGQGLGNVTNVAGNPTASPVTYATGFTTTRTVIGNADGYDISSGDGIRLFYDVDLDGGATLLKLHVVPMAADIIGGNVPSPIGVTPQFPPDLVVLSAAAGPLKPGSAAIQFDADRRGSILIDVPSPLVRFEVETDTVGATSKIALAVQSTLNYAGS